MKNNTKNLRMALIAVLAVAFVPVVCEAGTLESAGADNSRHCKNVKLKDFLSAQETKSPPGPIYFPPVDDYLGWTDHNFTTFALVDYAGLANKYIKKATGHSLGTQVKGNVVKCLLPNGDAQITVDLETTRALGFAQSIKALADNGFDFLITPTIFGNKAQDVVSGAAAATGEADLFATFVIKPDKDGKHPLPSLVDALQDQFATYAPVTFKFKSKISGKCTKTGKRGYLIVDQAAATATDDSNAITRVFSKETVSVSCLEK